jgi:RNA polymerase primary sigma factor
MEEKISPINEYFKDIGSFVKQIDRQEEAELWRKVKRGDKTARESLVRMYLRLVVPTAKRFHRAGAELLDLIEEGNLGLLQAIDKFDPSKGYRFSTYAIHWIEQYVRRFAEEQSGTIKVPAHAWENLRMWTKSWERLKSKLARQPTLGEMADKMRVTARQVCSILNTFSAAYGIDSLSSGAGDETDSTLEDTLTDYNKGNPEALMLDKTNKKDFMKILDGIEPRDKEILIMRHGVNGEEPLTLADISKKLGISRERVRQIEERAVICVRKKARQIGLMEEREKKFGERGVYAGMKLKSKTNILGEEIGGAGIDKLLRKNGLRQSSKRSKLKRKK